MDFIDASRLKSKKMSVDNEIAVRRLAERYGINPDQSNAKLANALARKIEKTPEVSKRIASAPTGESEKFRQSRERRIGVPPEA